MTKQLPLGVQLNDEATLDNFLFLDSTQALKAALEQLLELRGDNPLFLHGAPGSGRSHLLEAVCHGAPSGRAQYLPLSQLLAMPGEEVLRSMEQLDILCLDDVDSLAGHSQWEEALFHCYNRCMESGCRLLCSASAAPAGLEFRLADLRSRLAAGLTLQIPRMTDAEKQQILQFRAGRRGMSLGPELAQFILARAGRDMAALMDVLDRLDRDSMVEQRQLTIPFVKQSLGW